MKTNAAPTCRIAGAILAGGKSRRMGGFPKGTLQMHDHLSIVEYLAREMTSAGIEETIIVASHDVYRHAGYRVIPDRRTGFGPLAGIEAALIYFAGTYQAIFCLPCDMPAMSTRQISALMEAFSRTSAPVVFAETGEANRHPLCGIVDSRLLPDVSNALDHETLCVDDLWQRIGGHGVYFGNAEAFINLNTLTDLRRWRRKRSTCTQAM